MIAWKAVIETDVMVALSIKSSSYNMHFVIGLPILHTAAHVVE